MPLDRNALALSLLVALVVGMLAAAGVWLGWPRPAGERSCQLELDRLNDLELMLRSQDQVLAELKNSNANLEARLINLELFESKPAGSLNLPEPYVKQVQRFFKSDAARDLLSPAAKQMGVWRFSDPVFIEPQLISVVYANGLQTETLICKIEIADYYDLQFNVLWDSLEGKR